MRPADIEVVRLAVVRQFFLAAHIAAVLDADIAVELVPLDVPRLGIDSPCTFGVDVAGYLQVHVVVDSPVVAQPFQEQSSLVLVAERRHDQSGGIRLCEREESERYSQWQRHVAHHQIRRTGGNVFAGFDFRLCHAQVEVRMLMIVAGRIFTACHHHLVAFHFLCLFGYDVPFALLGHDVADESFLRLDVVGYLAGLVTLFAVLEHGFAFPLLGHGVIYAHGIDRRTVGFHTDIFGVQFHCFVVQHALSVQYGSTVAKHDNGVL